MLGKILNITSLQNHIIKDLTKIIRSNNQKEIKSFICIHTNVFAYLICILTGDIHGKTNNQRDFIHELYGARFCNKG